MSEDATEDGSTALLQLKSLEGKLPPLASEQGQEMEEKFNVDSQQTAAPEERSGV